MLKLQVVESKTKSVNNAYPTLISSTTMNRFTLNQFASKLLNLKHNDAIVILESDSNDLNDRFYIAIPEFKHEGVKVTNSSKSMNDGEVLNFSHSGVYSRMLQNNPNALNLSPNALEELGLVLGRKTKNNSKTYTALKRVTFRIKEGIEIENGMIVYPLTDAVFENHIPKNFKSKTADNQLTLDDVIEDTIKRHDGTGDIIGNTFGIEDNSGDDSNNTTEL